MIGTRYTEELINDYFSKGYWDSTTLVDVFDRNAIEYPDKHAVVDSRTVLTWSQVKQLSDRLAFGFLELGINKDETIIAQLPNCVEHVLVRVALQKAGILGAFPPTTFRHTEMENCLKTLAGVGVMIPLEYRGFDYFKMIKEIRPHLPNLRHVFIVGDRVPEGAISINEMCDRPLEDKYPPERLQKAKFGPSEVSVLWVSSGTTGMPKLCEWANGAIILGGECLIDRAKSTSDDVFGAFAPLSGGAGFMCLITAPHVSAKVVLLDRFEAEEAFKLIERERVTFVFTVPTVLVRMLRHADIGRYDLSSLRVIRSSAATLPFDIAAEAEEKLGCPVIQGYSSSEAYLITQVAIDDPSEVRRVAVGKPVPGNKVKLVDDVGKKVPQGEIGEVWVRGPGTASGVYKDVEATRLTWGKLGKGGWCRTGDLGKLDEHGNLVLVGRKKDMIIRGGQNIYPAEIEGVLLLHPKVSEVSIVGMPDLIMGEKPCAYIVLKPGQHLTFEEMISFLRERKIAPFKLPERLEIVDRFPMAAGGLKVKKAELTKDIIQKLKAEKKLDLFA